MKYNFLGKSDLKVSNYCLGTMTYGEQTSEMDAHLQMDKAFDSGIKFFDPAEMNKAKVVASSMTKYYQN